jgi:hypothetical protein
MNSVIWCRKSNTFRTVACKSDRRTGTILIYSIKFFSSVHCAYVCVCTNWRRCFVPLCCSYVCSSFHTSIFLFSDGLNKRTLVIRIGVSDSRCRLWVRRCGLTQFDSPEFDSSFGGTPYRASNLSINLILIIIIIIISISVFREN